MQKKFKEGDIVFMKAADDDPLEYIKQQGLVGQKAVILKQLRPGEFTVQWLKPYNTSAISSLTFALKDDMFITSEEMELARECHASKPL